MCRDGKMDISKCAKPLLRCRQALLSRVCCCTTCENQTATWRLSVKRAQAQFDKVEDRAVIDLDNIVGRFFELTITIQRVSEITIFL